MVYVKHFTSLCGDNFTMELSKSLKLTQKEVASHMLMTQQQYSRFENGIFELNYAQIKELCRYLDITPNDLFDFQP